MSKYCSTLAPPTAAGDRKALDDRRAAVYQRRRWYRIHAEVEHTKERSST
jgi:hypothetical protein